jgi:hypothetical protein
MRLLLALAAVLSAWSCSAGTFNSSLNTANQRTPREIDELTTSERRALLDRAEVYRPIDTASLNLLAGPPGKGGFRFDEEIACQFDWPKEPLSGLTPKFDCAIGPKDVVKVKYGDDNGEVFAEVAATRLFWALGFFADRMYPVRVTCLGCPKDPFKASTTEWRLGRPGNVGTRVYNAATIERKFDGKKIEARNAKGWSWRELDSVAANAAGASRAEVDALKLLAAFIQHVDSKPENQALVCADGAVTKDAAGNETCTRPLLVVKDLGSSFAAAGRFTFPKMKLESWASVPIWRDGATCQAHLVSSLVGTLAHPRISEEGRRFLAERLSLLSDEQLHDLFTAARVERHVGDRVDGRQVTAADWVRVFKDKRDQIVTHRCPGHTDN